jgi:S-adenosylmethionine:tRNA ribosyltransferase-isomerase
MSNPRIIHIEDYNYQLPPERIAQYPLETRDASRLLVFNNGSLSPAKFTELPEHLPSESMLVFNDTRVIRARFIFYKPSGARIEIFCLEPVFPTSELQQAMASNTESHWKCYVGNLKKWKQGKLQLETSLKHKPINVWAEKTGSEKDTINIRFTWSDQSKTFSELMENAGHIPLPPYINREDEELDQSRYQTIFASEQGSVAAPTAGLHFTESIMNALDQKGIARKWVTLHVGAGTFKPVSSDSIGQHEMHFEKYSVARDLIMKLLENLSKPVIPVGTTSMRTLESLYWLGVKILSSAAQVELITNQWEPYEHNDSEINTETALTALLKYMDYWNLNTLNASTGLLIAPGYKFRICTGLITNFHLPKSTLLLLVAALVGPGWRNAYQYAIDQKFRFLSYGDSCLFIP